MTDTPNGPRPTPVADYSEADKVMVEQDKKAFLTLAVCLSNEITKTLRVHYTAEALWGGLVEKIEGNAEIRDIKRAILKEEFNMFNHRQGESMGDLTRGFRSCWLG